MAYTRTNWVEEETPLSAQNFNNIEDGIEELQSQKVDKVSGKALSDQNYTAAEKTKLAGIAEGAEVNVQPDWNQSDTSADDYIKNKPANATTSSDGFMSAADKASLDRKPDIFMQNELGGLDLVDTDDLKIKFNAPLAVSVQRSGTDEGSIRQETIGIYDATPSARGAMSAADKAKLNSINIFSLTATGATTTIPAGGTTTINFNCATTDCELAAIQSISLADGVAICGIAKKASSGRLTGWTVKVVNTTGSTVQVGAPKITAVIIEEEIS